MAGGINLATRYVKYIDEMFAKESQVKIALSSNAEYKGDREFVIYSFPVVPIVDYSRMGTQRYGTPTDLNRNKQSVFVLQDRAFSYIVDLGDKAQSEYLTDAGAQLTRQTKLATIPEFDTYCFKVLADAAVNAGHSNATQLTKSNAYEYFLKGMESLSNYDVPDQGRVAFCSYAFANLLKQDPAFMRYGNLSQEMIVKGVMGEVDGCKIVKVNSNRLPAGAAFIITHPVAACAPQQLDEYKIHDNPPGISGWLVEARQLYDCFVYDNKAGAIYYHGAQPVLKDLRFTTGASNRNKSTIYMNQKKEKTTNRWFYITARNYASLPVPVYGTALAMSQSTDPWYNAIEITNAQTEITPTSNHTVIGVVETESTLLPVAWHTEKLNIG